MTNQQENKSVTSERRGVAEWITITREERRNALNPEVLEAIRTRILAIAKDSSLRAIVLTGAGEQAFCAGADLSLGKGVFSEGFNEPTTHFGRLARSVREIGVPLIARINGSCVAGGMGLMALCDLAIAADHAKFGLTEVRVGVFPMQVLVYLRRILHQRHLNELCLRGTLIDANEACRIGLINAVVPFDQLDSQIESLIHDVAKASPVALRRGKAVIAAMESMAFAEAISYAEAQITITSCSDDAREGLAAFTEKRPPTWTLKSTA